jgi:signal transduction histidine kinase
VPKDALMSRAELDGNLVAAAAHELKTPLTIISTIAAGTRGGLFGTVNQEVDGQLARIEMTAARLLNVVEGLLGFEKIKAGVRSLALEPVNLTSVTRLAINELQLLADENRQEISLLAVQQVPLVQASPQFAHQVVYNLLNNALKYSPPRSHVVITLRREGDFVCLTISDQAPVLSATDKRHIFKKFSPLSARSGLPGSNGLGLYLSRSLAVMMGGDLTHRALMRGNRFYVRLPLVEQLALFEAA